MGKCKNQWSQAKIFLLRSSGRTDKPFLMCSEKTEAADGSWHKPLQILGLNSVNYLDLGTSVGASWLSLHTFVDKVCPYTYRDQDMVENES